MFWTPHRRQHPACVLVVFPARKAAPRPGAGKIDAHDLRANDADVNVTGAAGVDVYATDELDVTVSGAGRVTYSGNPKVNKKVNGAGQVIKKEGISA